MLIMELPLVGREGKKTMAERKVLGAGEAARAHLVLC